MNTQTEYDLHGKIDNLDSAKISKDNFLKLNYIVTPIFMALVYYVFYRRAIKR